MTPKECSKCGGKSRVLSTRTNPARVYRRRSCLLCEHRWTTLEIRLSEYEGLINDKRYLLQIRKIAEGKY